MQQGFNYRRFYSLLREMPAADKDELVYQFTSGRTTHLHEMSVEEYNAMCGSMERTTGEDKRREAIYAELKRQRSICLKLMQRLGVNTGDWSRVDDFCRHPRISGKAFRQLSAEELEKVSVKLRIIERKGGLKPHVGDDGKAHFIIPISYEL